MASAISALRWLTGSSGGNEIGGIAARRAARAAAAASARPLAERLGPERPDRACDRPDRVCGDAATSAGEDMTDRGSIQAGRINRVSPRYITVFRAAAFRRRPAWRGRVS